MSTEVQEYIDTLDATIRQVAADARTVAKLLRRAPAFVTPGADGRFYVMGGNPVSRWWAARRFRRSILRPAPLLCRPPAIFGPDPQLLALRQEAASFNEERRAIDAKMKAQLDALRATLARTPAP